MTCSGAIELRRATGSDAGALAELYLRSFRAAMPSISLVHTDQQVREWFPTVLATRETWIAVSAEDGILGLLALSDDEVEHLYVDPSCWRSGIGSKLVGLAKRRRSEGLSLYAFQVNEAALAFYARHGFRIVDVSDGSRNEEREPDVRLAWSPEKREAAPRSQKPGGGE